MTEFVPYEMGKPFYLVLVHHPVTGNTQREYAGYDRERALARYASVASWRNWLESYGQVLSHNPLQVEQRRAPHHTIEVLKDGMPFVFEGITEAPVEDLSLERE